jgi:hypothetical protein
MIEGGAFHSDARLKRVGAIALWTLPGVGSSPNGSAFAVTMMRDVDLLSLDPPRRPVGHAAS